MKKVLFIFISIYSSLILVTDLKGADPKMSACTAKVNINPKSNLPVHDSLYARALVIDVDDRRIAIIS